MKYTLNAPLSGKSSEQHSAFAALKKLFGLLAGDGKKRVLAALTAMLINSGLALIAPRIVGFTIDTYVQAKDYHGVLLFTGLLVGIYILSFFASYIQTKFMGTVSQQMLFRLRNTIFSKLQELPVAFFNQNKAGDLISRINNDTDKLNQFFSQSLMQFVSSLFIMTGAGIFILVINPRLGAATLIPGLAIVIFTKLISPWVKRKNAQSMQSTGGLSAEIQESLNNFKVIVAFNRQDYFRESFHAANRKNFSASVKSGVANNIFNPFYEIAAHSGQLIVFSYGVYLISTGHLTLGVLISFFIYAARFYDPVRQMAALWASFQQALAAWDRISQILAFTNDLHVITDEKEPVSGSPIIEFKDVGFSYSEDAKVLHDVSFSLEAGKTYALVGPTGGGKTTTASLIARLYDPTHGKVLLQGRDIRSYEAEERTKLIGFILQEPYLFSGTVGDNILYGSGEASTGNHEKLLADLRAANLEGLLDKFDKGLDTPVTGSGEILSLGQRQIIAFMRAVLRKPAILIMDEATANIDTVTEQILESILEKLPKETTRVTIAHRLNTIESADEIFFVNGGSIIRAGSLEHAVEMLLHGKRSS